MFTVGALARPNVKLVFVLLRPILFVSGNDTKVHNEVFLENNAYIIKSHTPGKMLGIKGTYLPPHRHRKAATFF